MMFYIVIGIVFVAGIFALCAIYDNECRLPDDMTFEEDED